MAIFDTDDGDSEIYVMDADGANIQRLTHRPGADGHPDWSPDGTKIVFTYLGVRNEMYGADHGLYVIDVDGTNLQQLTAGGRTEGHPNW
jgi:Tol biopolymer transport system component